MIWRTLWAPDALPAIRLTSLCPLSKEVERGLREYTWTYFTSISFFVSTNDLPLFAFAVILYK